MNKDRTNIKRKKMYNEIKKDWKKGSIKYFNKGLS